MTGVQTCALPISCARVQAGAPSGEYIDIDDVSSSESEDDSHPTQQSGQGEAPTAQGAIHFNNPKITASKSTSATDVHYFFEKTRINGSAENASECFCILDYGYFDSLVTLCRKSKEADANWPSGKYEYSVKTLTTLL